MPAPFFFLLGPLIAALGVYALRRWQTVATLSGTLALLLLWAILVSASLEGTGRDASWVILGRSFSLTEQIRATLLVAYASLVLVYLITLLLPQGSLFVPLSLGSLSPLAGGLMVRQTVFGMILILIAAGLLTVLIQGRRPGSTLAALRYLKMIALAVPLMLVAGWMLGTDQVLFLPASTSLLALGLIILLGGFPFHIWVAPVIVEARPFASAFVFGVVQLVVAAFGFSLLSGSPVIQRNILFLQLLRVSGTASVILGGVQALTAQSFGRLMAYLLLTDMGAVLVLLTSEAQDARKVLMVLLLMRIVSLILAGLGLGLVRHRAEQSVGAANRFAAGWRQARRTPLGLALFIYGSLSLIGLPLTPGFSGRWATIALVAEEAAWLAVIMLLAAGAGTVAVLRCLGSLMSAPEEADRPPVPEAAVLRIAAGLLFAAGLFLALYPQSLVSLARRLAEVVGS